MLDALPNCPTTFAEVNDLALCDALDIITKHGGEPLPSGEQLPNLTLLQREVHTSLIEELERRYDLEGLDEHVRAWMRQQPEGAPLSAGYAFEVTSWVRTHTDEPQTP